MRRKTTPVGETQKPLGHKRGASPHRQKHNRTVERFCRGRPRQCICGNKSITTVNCGVSERLLTSILRCTTHRAELQADRAQRFGVIIILTEIKTGFDARLFPYCSQQLKHFLSSPRFSSRKTFKSSRYSSGLPLTQSSKASAVLSASFSFLICFP